MGPRVNYYRDSDSDLFRGCCVDVGKFIMKILKFTTVTQEESSIGPHSVRVPSKTALASAMCPLDTHSSDISNP